MKCNKNNECSQCKNNAFLAHKNKCECLSGFTFNIQKNRCIANCAEGNYFNKTLSKCENCIEKCKNCFEGESLECIDNAEHKNSKCECKVGFNFNKSSKICEINYKIVKTST